MIDSQSCCQVFELKKLLAAPKFSAGTGQQMCDTTMQALHDWNIPLKHVVSLCFDTTSSNIGIHKGAYTLLEHQIEHGLLHTDCRHHINENTLSHVFKLWFGGSTGPEIKLFECFYDSWGKIQAEEWIAIDLDAEIYMAN